MLKDNDEDVDDNKTVDNEPVDVETVLDSSYAYISNNPVGVQLINKDETYKLKVHS